MTDVFAELGRLAALIRQLQGVLKLVSDKHFALGTATLTWPGGSNYSNNLTVTHGHGFTPFIVLPIQGQAGPGPANEIRVHAYNFTATTFVAFAKYDPSVPGAGFTQAFVWLAIG